MVEQGQTQARLGRAKPDRPSAMHDGVHGARLLGVLMRPPFLPQATPYDVEALVMGSKMQCGPTAISGGLVDDRWVSPEQLGDLPSPPHSS